MQSDSKPKNPYKLLMVEDDRLDQMAFKRMVKEQQLDYDYTIAGSVSQAREILSEKKFDIVFIDYLLGDGTAFDVLDQVVDTPAVFATGTGSEELAVKAMKSGASDYLIKDPARNYLKVLPEVIKNAVKHKKAEDELKKYHDNLVELVAEQTEQLAEEKELLAVTLSSMGDGVIAADAENRVMLLNTAAEKLIGWKFDDVQHKPVGEVFRVIDEKTKQPVDSPIDKALVSNQIESAGDHDALLTRFGQRRPISATAAPIRNYDGTVTGIVMVFRDVSAQREIDRLKADFISSVSHELRTPLTSIKAYTETILCDENMPPETQREFLQIIDEESDRLTKLINGILEISRIESGTIEIVQEPVNINALMSRVVLDMEAFAKKKDVNLNTDIEPNLPELIGDENKIQSMISNLINNAVKFTPEHGTVSVSVNKDNDRLRMVVSDTGMGIPASDLPKIFGRFYRVHRPGKQIQGTGLGLAIVKEIVVRHNGTIQVESEPDQGTTFTVFLPLVPQTAPLAVSDNTEI
jgi:PAS domain S-box-containing protein